MQPGRLVAICWAFDIGSGTCLRNQVTVSHDDGHVWSAPIDTSHQAESANLLYLGGERLLSIHCHRGREVGLVVRLVDFSGDRWTPLEERVIWGASMAQQTRDGQSFYEFAGSIRFGQGSLLRLRDGDILATHWCVVDGQGRVLTHRLRLTGSDIS
jgi:hypothetical protein